MRPMRFALVAAPSVLVAASLSAQTELRPAPSGRGTTEVVLSKPVPEGQPAGPSYRIRVDYGQPHLRGRTLHTGELVPYDQPWRTGANAATTLMTEVDLVVGGANIPKGTYVLFTIPSATGWKLVLQKDANQGGEYKQENDVARVDLKVRTLSAPLESLTIWLVPTAGAARGELRISWGLTEASTEWAVK
ncbi:MAG TPA: DUF2911 domain-containing protein [Gemmatimonadales bacterium]